MQLDSIIRKVPVLRLRWGRVLTISAALVAGAVGCSSEDADTAPSESASTVIDDTAPSASSSAVVAESAAPEPTAASDIVVTDDRVGQECLPADAGGLLDDPVVTPSIEGVEVFTGLTHGHGDQCIDYAQNPPVGGDHSATWQACQFYDGAIDPEQGVHSIEHGAVWITYDPSLDATQREVLAGLAGDFVLVSPWNRDPLPTPIVASAWGLQLAVGSTDDPRLAEFVKTYANGPQNPEAGAPCVGGGSTETL